MANKKSLKISCKKEKKNLAIRAGIWYYTKARLRQICVEAGGCGRYGRFFRGVCPILNRAKTDNWQNSVFMRLQKPCFGGAVGFCAVKRFCGYSLKTVRTRV